MACLFYFLAVEENCPASKLKKNQFQPCNPVQPVLILKPLQREIVVAT
jgi:hypothetical protein